MTVVQEMIKRHRGGNITYSQVAEYQSCARELNRMVKIHHRIDLVDAIISKIHGMTGIPAYYECEKNSNT
jgi:hypothetical protein